MVLKEMALGAGALAAIPAVAAAQFAPDAAAIERDVAFLVKYMPPQDAPATERWLAETAALAEEAGAAAPRNANTASIGCKPFFAQLCRIG